MLSATSNDLNTATDGRILNVEAISASANSTGVTIDLSNQSEGFTITGGTGNDTITGGGGSDVIHGGAGLDTVAYASASTDHAVAWNGATGVATVTANATAGDTGTTGDVIDGAGKIQFTDHAVFLVGGAGSDYTTIQSAIDAAASGDTIMIASGTYNENLSIGGKFLTLQGVDDSGVNKTTLTGQINASGTLDGALTIKDMAIDATGHQYGLFVSSNSTGYQGSIVLDNTTISGAQSTGFAYIRPGQRLDPDADRHRRRHHHHQLRVLQQRHGDVTGRRSRRHPAVRLQQGSDDQRCHHPRSGQLRPEGDPAARPAGR